MSEKLLSVIVPTYNVDKYIVECVDSLLLQISAPNEIIIVNDSSTDDTLHLLNQHYANLPQVQIITVPNGGAGLARDKGIELARGEFLFFCDPDDRVAPGLVSELQQVVQTHPQVELFCFNSIIFDHDQPHRTSKKVRHELSGLQSPLQVFSSLLRNGSYTSAAWNYLLKRSVIDKYHLRFQHRVHEDHCFSLGAFLKSHHAWVSNKSYYQQRVRQGSLTHGHKNSDYFLQRYHAFLQAYHDLIITLGKNKWRSQLQKEYLLHSFRLMIYLSLYNRTPVPYYVINAIRFLGREIKPAGLKEWLLLNYPEFFIRMQNYKVIKELKKNRLIPKSVPVV
ncbi:glycosyltransferase family 2 protein [Pantoea cypripedii]|uniref:Glycosyl transferase n=1 Tax=Pantoea cypripedii TaxID=55209 RepID=A0A1X1EST0_PANCY|nr:glycosyltransferase family 2 protein [Pantoea cypripedii]MBP2197134.1 glycosyltransferase involved in cell wall biosynthesis [Pantoea cypripedii]ORM93069.1 glycosyl transferase [Pantoea cypripedii]